MINVERLKYRNPLEQKSIPTELNAVTLATYTLSSKAVGVHVAGYN